MRGTLWKASLNLWASLFLNVILFALAPCRLLGPYGSRIEVNDAAVSVAAKRTSVLL